MGLHFNCGDCWDNPCTCGRDWKERSVEYLESMIKTLQKVLAEKKEELGMK